ncbi:M protein, serotype 24-like [Maniola jurtina]|uniref:M protein, serotype 24-like n=1 Tax=Maniola jurtina TaxID=191418 RepID=UPI001E688690|nr:M protein, serotype 24-like [Maniola jurtina]
MNEVETKEVDISGSDSDSAASFMSVGAESTMSTARKRPLSGEEVAVAPKEGPAKRGRGRPPTSGKYVGLAQAKRSLEAAKRAAEQAEIEATENKEVAELTAEIFCGRARQLSETSSAASDGMEVEGLTGMELNSRVHSAVNTIKTVAKASKGLKGTNQKALQNAAAAIEEAAEVLLRRTSTDEVKRLQAENAKLTKEMAELRFEQEKLRADLQKIRQGKREKEGSSKPAQEEYQSEQFHLLLKEVSSLSARFSVIEGRVLRPPLAADRGVAGNVTSSFAEMVAKPSTSAPQSRKAAQKSSSQPSQKTPEITTSRKGKGKGKASAATPAPDAEQPSTSHGGCSAPSDAEHQSHSNTPPNGGQWQTAGAKKEAKKAKTKANKAAKQAAQKTAKQQARLRTPRSAAVVLTLRPDVKEKGLTYATVLAKAKAEIELGELGIAGVRCKTTVTGARMLEVAGASSGPQADALAEKLKASLEPMGVKVSRPTKNAELRILGLDDSVNTEELEATIARVGDCSPAQVKSSPISSGFNGLGTAVVSCPVAAAKKLAEGQDLAAQDHEVLPMSRGGACRGPMFLGDRPQ